jgi:hypothetical protein
MRDTILDLEQNLDFLMMVNHCTHLVQQYQLQPAETAALLSYLQFIVGVRIVNEDDPVKIAAFFHDWETDDAV